MAKNPFIYKDLLFPLGGLNRKYAYQVQSPYTTVDALNVRPYRMESRRMSGGSRPGLDKWHKDALGGMVSFLGLARGTRVLWRTGEDGAIITDVENHDITNLNVSPMYITDDFLGGTLDGKWETMTDCARPNVDPNPANDKYGSPVGAVYKSLSVIDTNQRMEASMIIGALPDKLNYGTYTLILGCADAAGNGGLSATVTITEDGLSVEGVELEDAILNGELVIRREGNGDWSISYGGEVITSGTGSTVDGQRFGFRLEAEDEGCIAAIDFISLAYYINVSAWENQYGEGDPGGELYVDNYAEFPIALSDGKIYTAIQDDKGNCLGWEEAENSLAIEQEKYVCTQQRLREVFIADYGPYRGAGTDGSLSSAGVLTATSIEDWTTLGIVENSDVVVILDAATGVSAGEYVITEVSQTGVVLGNYTGTGTGTCSWQISVSPKVFNADTNKITVFQATTGNVPINCPLICLYRDRLVMAGAELEPHLWYMSRQGDPYDWNYVEDAESTETDYGIAIAGQNSNAGIISQPIRALMPHSDDYLVFGYDSQLWILRGDPVAGGQLDCISRTVGIVGKRAWCYGPSGEIFFMSHNGVHRLEAGGSSLPQMISYSNLPAELCKHTYRENIQMAYDTNALGIHIFIEGQKAGWFFSVENESFWPVLYASGAEVTSLVEYKNGVLMGCKDGFVRTHKDNSVTDDGRPFDSYVVMGPVRLGRDDYGRGVLQKLGVTMCGSMGIGGMDFDFFTADEPIEAAGKYEAGEIAETQSPYRDTSILMSRLSGGCMLLKVGLTAEAQGNRPRWWGMERLGAYIKSTGRFRE